MAIDWETVRAVYEIGEVSERALAHEHGISHTRSVKGGAGRARSTQKIITGTPRHPLLAPGLALLQTRPRSGGMADRGGDRPARRSRQETARFPAPRPANRADPPAPSVSHILRRNARFASSQRACAQSQTACVGPTRQSQLICATCCMDRRCGRIEPHPCSGLYDADVLRASQLQHSVQHIDGDRHLGRLSPVRLRAQPFTDDALPARHIGLHQGAPVVP